MTAPPEDIVVHGRLTGVEMRNAGWHRFSILEPGNQYPTRADTKKKELVDQAMALMNQDVSAEIRKQESTNINEYTGEPFVNSYLNSIAPSMVGAQQQQQQQNTTQVVQPQQSNNAAQQLQPQNIVQPGVSGFEKDMTVWRQTAAKVVAMSIEVLPEDQRNVVGLIRACEVWLAYFQHGPYRFGVQPGGGLVEHDGRQLVGDASEGNPARVEPMVPAGSIDNPTTCPECGFTDGIHAVGCPNADYV